MQASVPVSDLALQRAFEVLAEAPDGVARMRELVLSLAVRGRLVAQNPNDEPARALLNRIAANRARLAKAGLLKESKQLRPHAPRPVPDGWGDVRFGSAFLEILTGPFGTSLRASDYRVGGVPVVNPQNLKRGGIVPTPETAVGLETMKRLRSFVLREHDIVVARRGEMGRCAVVGRAEAGWLCGTGSLVLRTEGMFPLYCTLFLRAPETVARLGGDSVGSTMANLNQRIMVNLPFAVPPLAEQHRIVARVDELMAWIDEFEAARTQREQARSAARDACLAALTTATTPAEVSVAWATLASRFDALLASPQDVAPLRQAILHLGVRGRLVAQDPRDEPASQLLDRLARNRSEAELDSYPALPEGWAVCCLGDLLTSIQAGWSPSCFDRPKEGNEYGVLKVSACSWGRFLAGENKALPEHTAVPRGIEVRTGDFLISRANTVELVARSVIVDECPPRLLLSDKTLRLSPHPELSTRFLHLANLGPDGRRHYEAAASGTSASMRNVSQQVIRSLPIMLPPVAEQHRIVARVDELLALCDQLEAQLAVAADAAAAFTSGLVRGKEAVIA